MGRLLNIATPLHQSTKRDYLERMMNNKAGCMKIARQFGKEFWDGERIYGYGGYRYDGRWEPVAKELIKKYGLSDNAKILDVGCGKGYLLYEFKKLLPQAEIHGFDISRYAIENAKVEIKECLFVQEAQGKYPFAKHYFDLAVSITTLHNLAVYDLKLALQEIERVGKNKYIVVEGYKNEKELFNLQCWALTCSAFFTPEEWLWLFKEFGYSGDYEFIYFA